MNLYIDCREAGLVPFFPEATVKQLSIGDAVVERDGVEIAIIERKTVADLAASIKDGRYREQSTRLNDSSVPNHNILYLIEGSLRGEKLPLPRKTLLASLVSLNYGKGFSVVRTESLEQTAEFIQVFFDKLSKEDGYTKGKSVEDCVVSTKKEKRDHITPGNINQLMLSQIPFVSTQTAEAVLEQYKTVAALTTALREDPTCLDRITFLNSTRKISSKSVNQLREFLL